MEARRFLLFGGKFVDYDSLTREEAIIQLKNSHNLVGLQRKVIADIYQYLKKPRDYLDDIGIACAENHIVLDFENGRFALVAPDYFTHVKDKINWHPGIIFCAGMPVARDIMIDPRGKAWDELLSKDNSEEIIKELRTPNNQKNIECVLKTGVKISLDKTLLMKRVHIGTYLQYRLI